MFKVLTDSDTVRCGLAAASHGGTVAIVSTAKLTVSQHAVLLQSSIVGKAVAGCNFVPPPPARQSCATVESILPVSLAQKLTVGGQPVVLETLHGQTLPLHLTLVQIQPPAAQAKLTTV